MGFRAKLTGRWLRANRRKKGRKIKDAPKVISKAMLYCYESETWPVNPQCIAKVAKAYDLDYGEMQELIEVIVKDYEQELLRAVKG